MKRNGDGAAGGKATQAAGAGLETWYFSIFVPFENIFYKKTPAKTFAENRPFLGVLGHDAKV